MKDEMKTSDKEVKAEVKCARCGEVVDPNIIHECKEDKKDETSNS